MYFHNSFIVFLLALFASQCLCLEDDSKTNIDMDMSMDKRQLVPLPRIGKRQTAIIPAPRIGRSDKSSSTGESLGAYGTENLVEPLDVQLRAAFIPRLGKRSRVQSEELSANDYADGNKYRQLVMIPGLGYRYFYPSLNQIGSEDEVFENEVDNLESSGQMRQLYENSKRTIPYTPRIGRAVFAPRIGKKATFVPRIG